MAKQKRESKKSNGATVGYEQQLWQMADALRGSMDAAEYKHVVLGLIFSSTSPMPSRNSTQNWKPKRRRAPIRKTRTNIER